MVLAFKTVSLSVASKPLLREVSFELSQGEVLALLGQNGAGKTSLLRAVIRLIKPSTGNIILAGSDLNSLPQSRIGQILSYVPQSIQVVFETLTHQFFRDLDDLHTKSLLEELNISKFITRSFLSLSGGERQRVLLASALSSRPSLLLLDELTQYADRATTIFLGEFLASYRKYFGLSILAVSHDVEWTARFTDRQILLEKGELIEIRKGSPIPSGTSGAENER